MHPINPISNTSCFRINVVLFRLILLVFSLLIHYFFYAFWFLSSVSLFFPIQTYSEIIPQYSSVTTGQRQHGQGMGLFFLHFFSIVSITVFYKSTIIGWIAKTWSFAKTIFTLSCVSSHHLIYHLWTVYLSICRNISFLK